MIKYYIYVIINTNHLYIIITIVDVENIITLNRRFG